MADMFVGEAMIWVSFHPLQYCHAMPVPFACGDLYLMNIVSAWVAFKLTWAIGHPAVYNPDLYVWVFHFLLLFHCSVFISLTFCILQNISWLFDFSSEFRVIWFLLSVLYCCCFGAMLCWSWFGFGLVLLPLQTVGV